MRNLILNPIILSILIPIFIVYFFLILRYAQHKQVALVLEKVIVVFLLILLIKPTVPPFTYLQFDALAGSDKSFASLIIQLGIYTFFVIVGRRLFSNFLKSFFLLFVDPFLGILLVLALLSALWSETPLVSLKFSLVQFTVSWLAVHLARKYDWQEINKYLCWMCLSSGILSILVAVAIPSIGVNEKGWQGIFPFPIKLGTCMALSIVVWSIQPRNSLRRRVVAISAVILSSLLLILSNSVQAIFTLITLLIFLGLLKIVRKFTSRQASVIIILLIFILLASYAIVTSNLETIFGTFGKDMTLTGRTEFWPQMLASLEKRPILGYGIQGFWQSWRGEANPAGHIFNSGGFVPPNGHNGFLDLAMELGWLGLIIFSISLTLNFIKAVALWRRANFLEAVFPLMLLGYIVMANISETQLFITSYIWFCYVLVAVRLNSPVRKVV